MDLNKCYELNEDEIKCDESSDDDINNICLLSMPSNFWFQDVVEESQQESSFTFWVLLGLFYPFPYLNIFLGFISFFIIKTVQNRDHNYRDCYYVPYVLYAWISVWFFSFRISHRPIRLLHTVYGDLSKEICILTLFMVGGNQ